MRRLVGLLLLVGLLAGALAVADVVVRRVAEEELAAAVEQRTPGTQGTTAEIGSFPFVGRLLVSGQVPVVRLRARETRVGALTLRGVAVTVHDVRLDTRSALRGQARITSAGRGRLAAVITEDDLAGQLPGVSVALTPGRAEVSGPGGVRGELITSGRGRLVVRAAGRSIGEIPLPRGGLLPCAPEVAIIQDGLGLACSFDEVPEVLLRSASR